MAITPTAEKWAHARIRTVELSSGAGEVQIEPIDETDLIYGDPENGVEPQVPNELTVIAERVAYEGIEAGALKALTPAEHIQLTRYRHWLIANRLVSPKLTVKQVRALPYEDQIQLFRVCIHSDLSERVMLASFRGLSGGEPSNGNGKASGGSAE